MRKLLKKISDLKNAYRVLEVMDKAGCDIEQVSNMNGYYKLKPKWYVSERDAKDLQKIVNVGGSRVLRIVIMQQ